MDNEISEDWYGRLAYAAYGSSTDNKNYQGHPMPDWYDLPEKIQAAWNNAALKVRESYERGGI